MSRLNRKAAFSHSPIANPQTPIHRLAASIQNYLHLPDPTPLYVVMGALVANTMRGYPVWMMLISPPSGGKTTLVKPLLSIPGVLELADLTPQALLSGVKKKDMAAGAKGGILRELPCYNGHSRGMFAMLDFARSLLSKDRKEVEAGLGVLGQLYDGQYIRNIGTEGGKTISWRGRVGFIAATTHKIDSYARANADMGERCLYYRYPESDGWAETNSMLSNPDPYEKDEAIQLAMQVFASEVGLDWEADEPPRQLSTREANHMIAIAQFVAAARSPVERHWKNEDVMMVAQSEMPPRLAGEMAQLLRGMERAGVGSTDAWKAVRRVAMDSLPANRRAILECMMSGMTSMAEIAEVTRVSDKTVRQSLEDLAMHRIVEKGREAGSGWWLTDWAAKRLEEL